MPACSSPPFLKLHRLALQALAEPFAASAAAQKKEARRPKAGPPKACSTCLLLLPAERRARILKDGQLTMIVYGQNEVLLWARRVAAFQQAMR